LQLREVSNDTDSHFDSKVFINPGDQAAKDRSGSASRVRASGPNWIRRNRKLLPRKPLKQPELKSEQTKAEQYRSEYPRFTPL
jgi:hypothetical protein